MTNDGEPFTIPVKISTGRNQQQQDGLKDMNQRSEKSFV